MQDKRTISGKVYVFVVEEREEATFKRFRPGKPDRLQPYSTNPGHETINARKTSPWLPGADAATTPNGGSPIARAPSRRRSLFSV